MTNRTVTTAIVLVLLALAVVSVAGSLLDKPQHTTFRKS